MPSTPAYNNSTLGKSIFSTGNKVGIGTTTPSGQLHVIGTGLISSRLGINNPVPSSVLDVIGESRVQGILYFNQNSTDAGDGTRNNCKIERIAAQNLVLTGGSNTIQLAGDGGKLILRASSVGVEIGSTFSNTYVMFNPNNSERARITPSGFLGIGTSTPSGHLHVIGSGFISNRLGIGTTNSTHELTVNGSGFIASGLAVSGLLSVNGTGISVSGHTHTSSNITDFNSTVSGLLPTIANSGDNRVLTSTGSSVGINAESSLTFDGTSLSSPILVSTNASALEGGEIQLAKAPSGTTSGNNVIVDVYNNQLRFFEQGGTNRGYYIDITTGGAGVATNLAAGGGSGVNITNPLDNRVLTNTGSSNGINAESNLTFDGSLLTVSGSGYFTNGCNVSGILNAQVIRQPIVSGTDAATITFDMNQSNVHTVRLGGNRTLAVTNVSVGQRFTIRLKQDTTPPRTVTWFSGVYWPSNRAPILTRVANAVDVFSFICTASGKYDGYIVGYNFPNA